jgi:phospholipid/cholesterol/gamma-HCH transport system ATP-binding protein
MLNNPVIEVEELSKAFGSNRVLDRFTMKLERGENLAILGKSGSGKSVLIKCMIRLIEPDGGTVKMLGRNVYELTQPELDSVRAKVGFLFQSNALYDSMTVRENLEFPLRRHRMKQALEEAEVEKLIREVLSNVGLEHTIDMMPSELSGGMRKRIALARTLILRPEIILYDEPTTGLDPITARGISQLINEVREKYQTSSIIISHDMNCIKSTSDRVIMLMDGQRFADDTFIHLSQSTNPRIKEFFD